MNKWNIRLINKYAKYAFCSALINSNSNRFIKNQQKPRNAWENLRKNNAESYQLQDERLPPKNQ